MLSTQIKKLIPGVTWKHPVIAAGLQVLNPVDWAVRSLKGLGHLPRLSLRVRSNGLRGQFGGSKFVQTGAFLLEELKKHGGITPGSDILEIGCGVGRNAFSLSTFLEGGSYTGIDIDKPSIEGAQANALLKEKGYRIEFLDVDNPEYNPDGRYKASDYVFEFGDESFDLVFLVSVFTHMLPKDIENYIKEISRMLKPGGRLLFSTFIMDYGQTFGPTEFKYGEGDWRSSHEDLPEICVGYYEGYLTRVLSENGLTMDTQAPVASTAGGSRDIPAGNKTTPFGQDIVVAYK